MTTELPSDEAIVAELRNTLSGAYQSSALGRVGGEWLFNLVGPLLGEASASNFNETERIIFERTKKNCSTCIKLSSCNKSYDGCNI